MPVFSYGDVTIAYEDTGEGSPLLCLAPGGMNSAMGVWANAAINPLERFGGAFRLISMDQRNAGASRGPLDLIDPWGSYDRTDQLALLDHLGVERFQVIGCCIGPSYALKMIERAPERVAAAVLQQPIGIDDNLELFRTMCRQWGEALAAARDDVDEESISAFTVAMWSGEFVLSVSRDFVANCATPLAVLPGVDEFHPGSIGREVAALAPASVLIDPWKDEAHLAGATEAVGSFLRTHAVR